MRQEGELEKTLLEESPVESTLSCAMATEECVMSASLVATQRYHPLGRSPSTRTVSWALSNDHSAPGIR